MKRRPAFTLVELLVVIAIIAVLVGLLMPAVQRVRESGNRAKCINNMKQITLALVQVEQKYNSYPPHSRPGVAPKVGTMIHLMPFLEQDQIFKDYNFSLNWNDAAQNVAMLQFQPASFLCPSNPNPALRSAEGYGVCDYGAIEFINPYAVTGHDPNTGTDSADARDLIRFNGVVRHYSPSGDGRGLMNRGDATTQTPRVKIDDVRDGVSNTIAFVEDTGRPMQYDRKRQSRGLLTSPLIGAAWADSEQPLGYHGAYFDPATGTYVPCSMNNDNHNEIYSFHYHGGVFSFADGSVRFVNHTVDVSVIAALCTRAGGENVTPDF